MWEEEVVDSNKINTIWIVKQNFVITTKYNNNVDEDYYNITYSICHVLSQSYWTVKNQSKSNLN